VRADESTSAFRSVEQFTLADLEAIRVVLRGGSVIDWHRLNLHGEDLSDFVATHEFDLSRESDQRRIESVKREAVDYLRRTFEFPIPRSIEAATTLELLRVAGTSGHKQVCACILLKTMHIIHHLQGRELLFMLPMSDAQIFHLVEEKVYRVVGGMMATGLPIVEFLGGRKHKDSLYTKLLSKTETIAAQIYDKLRFRIVTRTKDDLFPVLNYLTRRLFPFNYAVPAQSTNTLVDFAGYCRRHPNLRAMVPTAQGGALDDNASATVDNVFSSRSYRVIHFVVDMPVRVPESILAAAGPSAHSLGHVVFVLVEFQIVDHATDLENERGEASHSRYKERQRQAVMERLRMGFRTPRPAALPSTPPPATRSSKPPRGRPSRGRKGS